MNSIWGRENIEGMLHHIQQLRRTYADNEFNALEYEIGKKIILSADFGVSETHMDKIEWERVTPLLDFINLSSLIIPV